MIEHLLVLKTGNPDLKIPPFPEHQIYESEKPDFETQQALVMSGSTASTF